MSYSFAVKGKTKEALMEAIKAQLEKVIETQPAHKHDQEAAVMNASRLSTLLVGEPPEGQVVWASMHGSNSTNGAGDLVSAGAGCTVYFGADVQDVS